VTDNIKDLLEQILGKNQPKQEVTYEEEKQEKDDKIGNELPTIV
jgi:hypothetical protein